MEREHERISVEEASKRSRWVPPDEVRLHPSWDRETDTVLFPKGSRLEKFLATDFGNACVVGLFLGVVVYVPLLVIVFAVKWAQ